MGQRTETRRAGKRGPCPRIEIAPVVLDDVEALNFASSEVHKQIGALFNPNLTAEMKEVQLGVIGRRLDALEKLLDGNQFITGDKYTVADADHLTFQFRGHVGQGP
jgi:glutathione S-transferase